MAWAGSASRSLSDPIQRLVRELARLPGIGEKTATRLTFHLVRRPESQVRELAAALIDVVDKVRLCSVCMNLTELDPCSLCADARLDPTLLCAVATPSELLAIERAGQYPGRYHVLGGRLSALEGVRPEDLAIDTLVKRVAAGGIDEVVLAMNATLEGQTTAHYLAERLEKFPIRLTQLAHGLPVGGELDYLDEGTLAQALRARRPVA